MESTRRLSAAVAIRGVLVHAACKAETIENIVRGLPLTALIIETDCPALKDAGVARWVERTRASLPILYLVKRKRIAQLASFLNKGNEISDFVVAPYPPEETAFRLAELIRLHRLRGHANVLCMGGLILDEAARQVSVDDAKVELTPNEYRILKCLVAHGSKAVSKQEMIDALFSTSDNAANLLEVHISRLRRKLVKANVKLRSIRSYGYLIEIQQ